MRDPKTPDCGIEGCTRAEYRAGLCRAHYELIPISERLQAANANAIANHEAAKERRAEAVRRAQSIVNEQA